MIPGTWYITTIKYARRRRRRALGYLRQLRSSRSATRRGILEVSIGEYILRIMHTAVAPSCRAQVLQTRCILHGSDVHYCRISWTSTCSGFRCQNYSYGIIKEITRKTIKNTHDIILRRYGRYGLVPVARHEKHVKTLSLGFGEGGCNNAVYWTNEN